MAKRRYVCQNCGALYYKPQGHCYHCDSWNTIVEEVSKQSISYQITGSDPIPITNISNSSLNRIVTSIREFDRVTGGGIVEGSLILMGGSPGIGKSTLLLQVAREVSKNGVVLYVTGEESTSQIKMRAERLGVKEENVLILSEIDVEKISHHIEKIKPTLVIIDSIQTMLTPKVESIPGSVTQVREATSLFQRICKRTGIPIIIVGHITKSGAIAGPKILEHLVDVVLYFEGEKIRDFRILRAEKNRFGSTREIGVFLMGSNGLRCVENPSEFFISDRYGEVSGSVVVPVLEGTRTLLVEIQALVTPTGFGVPTRRAEGISANRLSLLLAVLEKRGGISIGGWDVFINVVGGVQIDEPASDLGIILAIASSFRDDPIPYDVCVLGEVGLGGEVRKVNMIENRISESIRMGFKKIVVPAGNYKNITQKANLIPVKSLKEALLKVLHG